MRFYNRESELSYLGDIACRAEAGAQFTIAVGRRRVGKTRLMFRFLESVSSLYFFVSKKSEALLCKEFIEQVKEKLQIPVFGEITTFKALFEMLMYESEKRSFTVVIDEFQEFYNINSAIYSEMQYVWDSYKDRSKINLVVCGSVYSLMSKIFEDKREPLFGRANERIIIKPFRVSLLKEIVSDIGKPFTAKDILAFYALTGGMPKYVELFVDKQVVGLKEILNEIFKPYSLLLDEGKNVLIEEFGKDYGTYFSILSLIASGKTSRQEIESILEKETGGFLERLEKDFSIIRKIRPVLSKPESRSVKFEIVDNFLTFWFRFIFKYRSAVEIQNFEYMKQVVERDFDTFSGIMLERYFAEKMIEEQKYTTIGRYWERGNKNEIDIVAINEDTKEAVIAEVKLNADKINIDKLKQKSQKLIQNLNGYSIEYKGLSLNDI